MRLTICSMFAAAAIVGACKPAAPPPATVDAQAEEAAIRRLEGAWSAAANKKDLAGTVAFYATDGATMWPDAPTSHGSDAIRAAWTEMFKLPGISLQFVPDKIAIAQGGDIATDEGRAIMGMDTPKGHVIDTTKYLVIWKKVDGTWKVAYDTYNANKPAAPAAPAK